MSLIHNKNFICFTTIPSRFDNLINIINYINLNFKNQFNRIKIYIPKKYIRFSNQYKIPSIVLNIDNVDIVKCDKDWGPATKFIGPLLDNNIDDKDNIIVIDDDNIKDLSWLNISKYYINKYPDSIIQLRVCSFLNIPINIKFKHIHGVSGFCFKKKILNNYNFYNYIQGLPISFLFIDDDILTYYIYLYKLKLVMTTEIVKRKYLSTSDSLVFQTGDLKRSKLRKQANTFLFNKFNFKFNLFNIS